MSADRSSLAYPTSFGPPPPYGEPRRRTFVPSILGDMELVTPASGLAVSVSDAKDQCRIDDTDSDNYLTNVVIPAATRQAEVKCQRQFLTAVYNLPIAGWWCGVLRLPRPPLQAVGSVKYYDSAGTLQTLPGTYYETRKPVDAPGNVAWLPGVSLPALQCSRNLPVVIQFTCGYGAAADLPPEAKAAILLIVAHAMRYRGDDDETGKRSDLEIPPRAVDLLNQLSWGAYA